MKSLNNLFIGFAFCFSSTMVSAAHAAEDHITYKNQRGSMWKMGALALFEQIFIPGDD